MTENTSNVPVWKPEFNNRIAAFAEAINVPEEKVREILTGLGVDGLTEQSLTIIESDEFLPMADLFEAFVDTKFTAKAKLRAGMPHLRGSTHLGETQIVSNNSVLSEVKELFSSQRPLASLSDSELLDRYDDSSTEVWRLLRERTHGRYCIVYSKDASVNKEVSLKLVRAARKQVTPDKFEVNGQLVKVHRAGDFPAIPIEESPFYPGKPLLEGFCADSNTNWTGISQEMRVLARLALQSENPSGNSVTGKVAMRPIWRNARDMTLKDFKQEYGEAALMYEELLSMNKLPTLVIFHGSPSVVCDSGFAK